MADPQFMESIDHGGTNGRLSFHHWASWFMEPQGGSTSRRVASNHSAGQASSNQMCPGGLTFGSRHWISTQCLLMVTVRAVASVFCAQVQLRPWGIYGSMPVMSKRPAVS